MTITDLVILWINLDDRPDRAKECVSQIQQLKLGSSAVRISAVNREQVGVLADTDSQHYFQGVVACKKSHFKAMESFLESDKSYAFILEDDFLFTDLLTKNEILRLLLEMKRSYIQLLQVGFLPRGNTLTGPFFKMANKFAFLKELINIKLYKIRGTNKIRRWTLKPGSHAYIVDRKMALYILDNSDLELKIPYDLWLSKLSSNANLERNTPKSARLRFSIVRQNDAFKSDIQL